MRRGPKPAKSKEAKPPVARKAPKNDGARVGDLEKRLAEALEQQAAAADILRLIAESPSDLPAVLDGILSGAIRLLGAEWGAMSRFDGELFHLVAQHGATPGFLETAPRFYPFAPDPDSPSTQAITERHPVYIEDAFEASYRRSRELARAEPSRSLLTLPPLREGRGIGTINLTWADVRPFPADRIKVLKTFADQAVIAIENVRLFNETKEALEQQKASGEILGVISSSPTDVQPVFDAIAKSGTTLCDAAWGAVIRFDGQRLTLMAQHNMTPSELELVRGTYPRTPTRGRATGRAIIERRTVHVPDIREAPDYQSPFQQALGFRTVLAVPMLRDGEPIGVLALWRREVRQFTDQQIALVETFAAQAVIAIEKLRLFTELQEKNQALTTAHAQVTETLEQQTATSEILRVISSSQTDVQPVFDTITQNALKLCGAASSLLTTFDGELLHLAALANVRPEEADALRRRFPQRPDLGGPGGRTILTGAAIHIPDTLEDHYFRRLHEAGQSLWARSMLALPLLREGETIGTIHVHKDEPGPFPESQIALLQTFADQAVIAIENVRLFNELEEKNRTITQAHAQVSEALERQTATSEILRVISSSPTDVQPVFDAIARNAVTLCSGRNALVLRFDGEMLHLAGHHGVSREGLERNQRAFPRRPWRDSPTGRAFLDRSVVHVPDRQAATEFPASTARGAGSLLAVPLLREQEAIGVIGVTRDLVGPFSSEQIEVLQTFADQAVIAIENVRLFTELQTTNRDLTTALDQQTATSEILRAITHAPTDTQPVFDTIVASAVRLLEGYSGALTRVAGDQIALVAITSPEEADAAAVRAFFPRALQSEGAHAQAIRDRAPFNIADYETDSRLPQSARIAARVRGYRSLVAVPLLRQDEAPWAIGVSRREPGGFTNDEIALLQTFADQAVIAIENVRLFNETKEALERQTATAEILRVISQSQTEVQPVFDAIVDNAMRLFRAWSASVLRLDGELIHLIAMRGGLPGSEEYMRRQQSPRPIYSATPAGRCVAT